MYRESVDGPSTSEVSHSLEKRRTCTDNVNDSQWYPSISISNYQTANGLMQSSGIDPNPIQLIWRSALIWMIPTCCLIWRRWRQKRHVSWKPSKSRREESRYQSLCQRFLWLSAPMNPRISFPSAVSTCPMTNSMSPITLVVLFVYDKHLVNLLCSMHYLLWNYILFW